jgi:hypothetical protein
MPVPDKFKLRRGLGDTVGALVTDSKPPLVSAASGSGFNPPRPAAADSKFDTTGTDSTARKTTPVSMVPMKKR